VYDEVSAHVEEDEDFIIKPVTRMSADVEDMTDVEVISDYIEEEQQITLTFDMPLSSSTKKEEEKEEVISYSLTDDEVKDLPVKDYVELITVTETNEKGDIRYALDDYAETDSSKNQKGQIHKEILEVDEEVVFERKVVNEPISEEVESSEIDPMNTPISELLKDRAEERRRKMKDFNYKFNSAKIEDIEKVPAYKRQGVDLDEVKHSSETDMSRTSIGLDDNDDIQLRSNNSFLHDNVD
jgi:cell division protein FtsZ